MPKAPTLAQVIENTPDRAGLAAHDEKYPEHAKQRAIIDKSQAIGEFLDRMSGGSRAKGAPFIRLYGRWRWMSIPKILAEYFKIDPNKIEEEKQAMLAELRGEHAGKS